MNRITILIFTILALWRLYISFTVKDGCWCFSLGMRLARKVGLVPSKYRLYSAEKEKYEIDRGCLVEQRAIIHGIVKCSKCGKEAKKKVKDKHDGSVWKDKGGNGDTRC